MLELRHSNGTIGYCCVMGRTHVHYSLADYPGEAGLASLRRLMELPLDASDEMIEEIGIAQNCICLSFENKANVHPETNPCDQRPVTGIS